MSPVTRPVVDASDLTRRPKGDANPLWWAVVGLVAIEVTVVGMFLASWFYLRMGEPQWPPAGFEAPPLLWPTLNLVILLGSVVSMAWAGRAALRGEQRKLVMGVWISCAGAVLVLLFRLLQFKALPFRWDEHAFGSLVWVLTGFHFAHVTATVLGTATIGVAAALGYFNRDRYIAVQVDALYWYFVALVWIPLYGVIYWGPRLLPPTP